MKKINNDSLYQAIAKISDSVPGDEWAKVPSYNSRKSEKSASNKKIVIMRGVSGAGKSTYTKKHFPEAKVVSADHYFNKTGVYTFNPSKLKEAHEECFDQFKFLIENEANLIVVDNTNTKIWEFKRYLDYAKEHAGYKVEVVRLEIDWQVAASRNVHGVPVASVQAMNSRMEPFNGELVVKQESR